MKRLLFLSVFLLTKPAWGSTQVIYAKDGSKATVLMPSLTTNPDAVAFYAALAVPEEEMNGKRTKKFKVADASGGEMLDVACAFSKLVPNNGTCAVIFHTGKNVSVSGGVQLRTAGAEAAALAKLFVPSLGEIFRSSDNHMSVQVSPESFAIFYQ